MTAVLRRPQRYTTVAPAYDLLAAEVVYRRGRQVAVDALRLRPGDQVVDLGCGTGLNFPLLARLVGPGGRIVGLDRSGPMLDQARRRARRPDWPEVRLLRADATTVAPADLARHLAGGRADALISTYALSLMPCWARAWEVALQVTRPGGGMAVVDMRLPSGRARWLAPLARLACALGGSDPGAQPWTAVEASCEDVEAFGLRGGHVQIRVGRRRPEAQAPGRPPSES